MAEEGSPPGAGTAGADAAPPPPPRKTPPLWPLLLVAVAAIVVPFKFWYDTWLGRRLPDEDLREALADDEKPRHVQHGIEEMSKRIGEDRAKAREFYPLLLSLVDHEEPVIRYHLAWVMGFDRDCEEFHSALLCLLADPALMVRQYAALSLSNFRDPACRPILLSMLHSQPVSADRAGTVASVLPSGTTVREGIELARVEVSDSEGADSGGAAVNAPMPGRVEEVEVEEGDEVAAGQVLLSLAPLEGQVLQVLAALNMVGAEEDLAEVERYAEGNVSGYSDAVRREARNTAGIIRTRAGKKE